MRCTHKLAYDYFIDYIPKRPPISIKYKPQCALIKKYFSSHVGLMMKMKTKMKGIGNARLRRQCARNFIIILVHVPLLQYYETN